MFKTKILILGPCESGKTTIANFLADATEIVGGDYRPTEGVRIVEFESNDLELGGENMDAEVELWDCSGDHKYKACWPAIQKDANGVILVLNPDKASHAQEAEQWHTDFVSRRGINNEHCIILIHHKPDNETATLVGSNPSFKLGHSLSSVQSLSTNIEKDGEALRMEFNNFLCGVISGLTEKRELEENNIIT